MLRINLGLRAESVGVVRVLMKPGGSSPEVVRAVERAVAWFESAKLTGLRVNPVKDAGVPGGLNKVVVSDPAARPLWARFYSIETNRPVFSDRDGAAKSTLAEIGPALRNHYAWYGTWPSKLLDDGIRCGRSGRRQGPRVGI